MPELPATATDEAVQRLARWAGAELSALQAAGRGASMLGVDAWLSAYASEPQTWLSAVGLGGEARRWQQRLAALPATTRPWLRRLRLAPSGLALRWLLVCSPRALPQLTKLVESGWAEWAEGRVVLPPIRRPLLASWSPLTPAAHAAAKRWWLGYIRRSLDDLDEWRVEDREALAGWLRSEPGAESLSVDELNRALAALRHTAAVGAVNDALRSRLALARCPRQTLALRRALGTAMIDIGAYGQGIALLRDGSRTSRVKRANAMLQLGEHERGRRLLKRLGPRPQDRNWGLQWALSSVFERRAEAEELLRLQLETAVNPRERAILFALYGEWAEARQQKACVPWYKRAVGHFVGVGDAIGAATSRARLARVLARQGQRDDAAEMALAAWQQAKRLPGPAARALAALACVEAGLASPDGLRRALSVAAVAEQPSLARDAQRALEPDGAAPILSVGSDGVRLNGEVLAGVGQGPPRRIVEYLCGRSGSPAATVEELFAAGWPGERASADSRRRRVQTAIWTLRRAGLRDAVQTVARNRYRLHARVISDEA